MIRIKLVLANLTGRMLRFVVRRSGADTQTYLQHAGIDVDRLSHQGNMRMPNVEAD